MVIAATLSPRRAATLCIGPRSGPVVVSGTPPVLPEPVLPGSNLGAGSSLGVGVGALPGGPRSILGGLTSEGLLSSPIVLREPPLLGCCSLAASCSRVARSSRQH